FVAPAAVDSWSFDVMDFVRQAVSRGLADDDWYLTSVQAGFEPWQNGAGLSVDAFSSTVVTVGEDPAGPGAPAVCEVSYSPQVWQGGFTTEIRVGNTAAEPVDDWRLAFTLPPGQQVTHAWNGSVTPVTGAVTVRGPEHGTRIAAGGSRTFGFQGTYSGAFAEPDAFTLNGTTCTVL
ncbi:cellulose binding domain-containing protein, partial [Streptomyces sp. TRM76130]|nr:cellulose binding domain-containing protein [Streptomyces sp. TRM76130]